MFLAFHNRILESIFSKKKKKRATGLDYKNVMEKVLIEVERSDLIQLKMLRKYLLYRWVYRVYKLL